MCSVKCKSWIWIGIVKSHGYHDYSHGKSWNIRCKMMSIVVIFNEFLDVSMVNGDIYGISFD